MDNILIYCVYMCLGNDSLEGEDNDKSGLVVGVDIAMIPQQVRLSNICNSQNTNQRATSINDVNDLFFAHILFLDPLPPNQG